MKTHSSVLPSPPGNSSPLARLRRKLSPRKSDDDDSNYYNNNPLLLSLPPASAAEAPTDVNNYPTSSSSSSSTHDPIVNNNVLGNNVDELQRVFNFFDEDGDGKISPAELRSCITTVGGQLSVEEAEAAVRSSDMDGDGLLGFQDFQSLMAGSSSSEEEKTEELKQAFGMYETEPGSGRITPTSLKRMLVRLGESTSINDCKAMIRTFDLNGDGVLSFHEFAVMMR